MKITIIGILLLISLFSFSQENKGIARIKKVQGIEVYVYSEPLRDYEIVGNVSSVTLTEVLDAVNVGLKSINDEDRATDVKCYTMSERIKLIVRNAMKKKTAKKKPIDFDAIIVDDDETGILIKFIE